MVSKLYAAGEDDPNFQIKITFDEDFNSSCIEDPASWTITVANPGRVGTPVVDPIGLDDINVSGRVVTIQARVVETGTVTVVEGDTQGEAPVFDGLICNQDDADKYEELFGREIKFADEVSWKLTNCAVYDELGNVCCDYEGEDCCVEPYCEECPEPEEGCDLTEPGACL